MCFVHAWMASVAPRSERFAVSMENRRPKQTFASLMRHAYCRSMTIKSNSNFTIVPAIPLGLLVKYMSRGGPGVERCSFFFEALGHSFDQREEVHDSLRVAILD